MCVHMTKWPLDLTKRWWQDYSCSFTPNVLTRKRQVECINLFKLTLCTSSAKICQIFPFKFGIYIKVMMCCMMLVGMQFSWVCTNTCSAYLQTVMWLEKFHTVNRTNPRNANNFLKKAPNLGLNLACIGCIQATWSFMLVPFLKLIWLQFLEYLTNFLEFSKGLRCSNYFCNHSYSYVDSFPFINLISYRYCRRAKAVFKELKQVPYVVELDERGLSSYLS